MYGVEDSSRIGEIGAWPVLIDNVWRQVPWSSLSSVAVNSFSTPNSVWMYNVSLTVVMKDGTTASYYLTRLKGITVVVPDPDTGEGRQERFVPFLNDPSPGRLAAINFE